MRHKTQTNAPAPAAFGTRLRKPIFAASALAALIVVVAGGLFQFRQTTRLAELDERYARTAAHVGRQVEIRLASYARVSKNLGPIAYGGKALTDADAEVLKYAQSELLGRSLAIVSGKQLAAANDAEQRARESLLRARRRLGRAKSLRKGPGPSDAQTKQRWEAAAVQLEETEVQLQTAAAVLVVRATELNSATLEARDASRGAKETAAALRVARQAMRIAEPTTSGARATQAPGATEQLAVASAAHDKATSAQSEMLKAELRAAQQHAAAIRTLSELQSAAQRDLEDTDRAEAAAVLERIPPDESDAINSKRLAERTLALRRSTRAARRAEEERRAQTKLLSKVTELTDDAGARQRKLGRLVMQAAPPSYRARLERCLSDEHDALRPQDERIRCLLSEFVAANGIDTRTLRHVSCEGLPGSDSPRFSATRDAVRFPIPDGAGLGPGCMEVSVADLVPRYRGPERAEWLSPMRDGVTEIVLLGRDGAALVAGDESQLRLERLPQFDVEGALTSAMIPDVSLGPKRYRAYLQPVGTHIAAPCTPQTCNASETPSVGVGLVVLVLVPEDRLTAQSLQIPPVGFLVALFSVGIVFLLFPSAKLWSLGPRSRFSRFDVALVASSAGLVALLVAIAAGAAVAHTRLSKVLDDRLAMVGAQQADVVATRLRRAEQSLQRFIADTQPHRQALGDEEATRALCTEQPAVDTSSTAEAALWPGFSRADSGALYCERVAYRKGEADCGSEADPQDCRQATWADTDGNQRLKFSHGENAAVPINVSNRGYFRRARREGCRGGHPSSIVDVVRSASSLEMIAVVAQPTCSGRDEFDGVASVTMSADALDPLTPPPGVSALVVDPQGRAMFASGRGVDNGQIVFDDVDNDVELRAVMDARISRFVDVRYLQTRVRIRVDYLREYDWFVLTMAPQRQAEAPVTSMVVLTLIGSGAFLAAEVFLVGVVFFLIRLLAPKWSWIPSAGGVPRPSARRSRMYEYGGWSALAVAGVCALVVASVPMPAATFWWTLASLFVATGVLWALPRIPAVQRWLAGRSKHKGRISIRYSFWYAALATVFYVAPALVFFAGAYDRVVENLVRSQQVHCARTMTQARETEIVTCAPSPIASPGHPGDTASGDPTPHYIDLLPGFWLSQKLSGHLHMVDTDARQRQQWQWHRHQWAAQGEPSADGYRLAGVTNAELAGHPSTWVHLQVRDGPTLCTRLPKLLEHGSGWPALLGLAPLLLLGFFASHATLQRLHFMRVLDNPPQPEAPPEPASPDEPAGWTFVKHEEDLRQVLVDTAVHGFATPHPTLQPVVRTLVRKGLLDPCTLKITDHALAQHIRSLHRSGRLPATTPSTATWDLVKMPLLTSLGVLVATLGVSEPDFGGQGMLAPALLALIPVALRAISALAGPGHKGDSE